MRSILCSIYCLEFAIAEVAEDVPGFVKDCASKEGRAHAQIKIITDASIAVGLFS